MKKKNFTIAFLVSLAVSSLPLACGDDEASPSGYDPGSGGSAAEATGGNAGDGGSSGQTAGGSGGRATGGGGNTTSGSGGEPSGGNGGRATGGTNVGGAGGALGGEAGIAGTGGVSDAGVGGASDGGAGGEGGVDEETARCERICRKAEPAMCPNQAGCVEHFCEIYFRDYPECEPYADTILKCLDERALPEEFVCWVGNPSPISMAGTCWPEIQAALDYFC